MKALKINEEDNKDKLRETHDAYLKEIEEAVEELRKANATKESKYEIRFGNLILVSGYNSVLESIQTDPKFVERIETETSP